MKMNVSNDSFYSFLNKNRDYFFQTHRELCLIPAPSRHEDARAEYCREWLEKNGADGVYIDEAKNVVFPFRCKGSGRLTVVNAHTDTVFPEETPLCFSDDGDIIRCPGVGDDTGCLAVMLFAAKFLVEEDFRPDGGILFVCNSGEEGLGNLLGIRRICEDYSGRIARHISLDADYGEVFDRCVGSHRYEVTVTTEGGHSFGDFGKKNAIAEAAKIISRIYELNVPQAPGIRTTYNVGTVSGGTSVNTIAQKASFLCEYRSDDVGCLEIMKSAFGRIFDEARAEGVRLDVRLVGDRPCANGADRREIDRMADLYSDIVREVVGIGTVRKSASTDCNIPLSLGIPSVCIGSMISGGTHTTEEWLKKDSLPAGLEIVVKFLAELTGEKR